MKCDKLTPIYIVEGYEQNPNLGKFTRPTILRYDILAYRKDDADTVIDDLKVENEKLSNALDKERSETIKYMDELCNAKNEIERLTIDKRNVELRAVIADATIEKLKENLRATKHALWMARKAHAVAMFSFWDSHYRDNPNAVYRNRTIDWLRNRWLLILDAIIKKEKKRSTNERTESSKSF